MVSKASEDLPDPDRPVKTMSESRGRSSETFFRLCSRAPRTMRRSATPVRTFLERSDRGGAPVFPRLGGATDNAGRMHGLRTIPCRPACPTPASHRIAHTFDSRCPQDTFTRWSDGARVGPMTDHVRDLDSVRDAT